VRVCAWLLEKSVALPLLCFLLSLTASTGLGILLTFLNIIEESGKAGERGRGRERKKR
jgi:hypothetical protein